MGGRKDNYASEQRTISAGLLGRQLLRKASLEDYLSIFQEQLWIAGHQLVMMIPLRCLFCTCLIPSGCYCSHNSIPELQHTMYYQTFHFTLYFVGSIPYKAATFPCLNLFDAFQAAFRLNFKIGGEVCKSLWCDSSLTPGLHLPLHFPQLTSLGPFRSLNL